MRSFEDNHRLSLPCASPTQSTIVSSYDISLPGRAKSAIATVRWARLELRVMSRGHQTGADGCVCMCANLLREGKCSLVWSLQTSPRMICPGQISNATQHIFFHLGNSGCVKNGTAPQHASLESCPCKSTVAQLSQLLLLSILRGLLLGV